MSEQQPGGYVHDANENPPSRPGPSPYLPPVPPWQRPTRPPLGGRWYARRVVLVPAVAAVALGVGIAAGHGGDKTNPTVAARGSAGATVTRSVPAATTTVTATAAAAEPRTVTRTVTHTATKTAGAGGPAGSGARTQSITGNDDGSRMAVSVLGYGTVYSSDDFFGPSRGHRYFGVEFRLVNTGTAKYDDAPSNGAVVMDSAGHQYDATIADDITAGPLLPSGVKLLPGNAARGFIVFEIPTNARVTGAQFSLDSGFADDTAQWSFVDAQQ
jgi:hypothetical protein